MTSIPKPVLKSVLWAMVLVGLWTVGSEASPKTVPSPSIDPAYLQKAPATETPAIADWQARWELARILSYVRKYPESIREYERVLSERPDLVEAKREMVHVLHWAGQSDKALSVLETLPQEHWDEATRLLAADIYVAKKQYPKAVAIYQKHVEAHPEDVAVRARLADVYGWTGQYAAALAQYTIALSQRPDDVQLRRRYAYVLIWSKRYDDAIAELRKTLPP